MSEPTPLRSVPDADPKAGVRKPCSTCKKRKALSQFARDSRSASGIRSQCRACVQERRRALSAKKRAAKTTTKKVDPAEQTIRTASRRAVEQLIKNHQAEFGRLVRTERMLLEGKKMTWTNLTNEFAMAD